MNRVTRFAVNAGCVGTLMTAIVAGVVTYAVIARPGKSRWEIFVPTALSCFCAAFFLRNLLVDHFHISRWLLNGAVIVGAAGTFILRKSEPQLADSVVMTVAIGIYLGLYIGCYFWLLSDPRIERHTD